MKYKLKTGQEIELNQEDVKEINKLFNFEKLDFEKMQEYYEQLHHHAKAKLEEISEHIIQDEDDIDIAAEYVAKNGTYKDFVKMLRYMRDYDIAYHILQGF
jgi:adenylosuccinate lyase